jgi:hypothetical protein
MGRTSALVGLFALGLCCLGLAWETGSLLWSYPTLGAVLTSPAINPSDGECRV